MFCPQFAKTSSPTVHPSRRGVRPGFALALSLLAIVIIGAMIAGGYLASVQYFRIGRNSLVEKRALAATELGLDSTYAMWNKSWNTVPVGTVTTLAYSAADSSWTDTVRVTKLNQLGSLIVSEGRAGGQWGQISARRRIGMLVRLNLPKVNQLGALTTRGTVNIGGSTAILGTDTTLAGWNCPPVGASIAGVAVPSFSNITFGGNCAGGSCISGSPLVSVTPTASDTNTYFSYGSLKWADLVAMADKTVSGTLTHVRPATAAPDATRRSTRTGAIRAGPVPLVPVRPISRSSTPPETSRSTATWAKACCS